MVVALSENETQQAILSQHFPFEADILPANFTPDPCIFLGQFENASSSRVAVSKCCPLEDCQNFEVKNTILLREIKKIITI
jgi:hypothetical protein